MSDLLPDVIKADQSQDIYYSNKLYENQKINKNMCDFNSNQISNQFNGDAKCILEYVLDTRRTYIQWQMVK